MKPANSLKQPPQVAGNTPKRLELGKPNLQNRRLLEVGSTENNTRSRRQLVRRVFNLGTFSRVESLHRRRGNIQKLVIAERNLQQQKA